jgi:L-carnitine CoA-transferase
VEVEIMQMKNIPQFGNLSGVKVLVHGSNVASPFGPSIMAENGATVIQIENSNAGDSGRVYEPPYMFTQERRNVLAMNLNIMSPEGREILLKLIKETDIFFEGNKGGTYEKWGLSDDYLWQVNPKLVIVHISGYGQTKTHAEI